MDFSAVSFTIARVSAYATIILTYYSSKSCINLTHFAVNTNFKLLLNFHIKLAMASIDTTTAPPSATTGKPSKPSPDRIGPVVDVGLRFLLFATALVAVIVMVTSKQSKLVTLVPGLSIHVVAKFSQSPAYVYFVAALSVACLHSVITGVLSVLVVLKPGGNSTTLQSHFVILDALLLGIVAAATGAAGGVGYIGYKGNSHTQWQKVCNHVGSFCAHFAVSIFLSLISSITLLLLVWLSVYTLSKKISIR
ncbi:hypothetical protein QVD17_13860 [Tagetes erecta]|uniref:CASP-like protein n=1 Tax=Tagetes erecta TaxID=13708 RepID=A0AAD8L0K4_TARER|nr:hypothetical protein QVD17_13860 [Tagetes erecta]